nr:hypothetical protein BaRGS_007482 [Batillaria attramentaria]
MQPGKHTLAALDDSLITKKTERYVSGGLLNCHSDSDPNAVVVDGSLKSAAEWKSFPFDDQNEKGLQRLDLDGYGMAELTLMKDGEECPETHFRVWCETQGTSPAFRVLVANLCVSDFLMGVYLMMIGSADARYRGEYLWKNREWVHSTACQAAGFLGLLSSEVSAFIICLITLDRLIVLRAPLNRDLHLTVRSAMATCGAAWLVGVVLALVPLLTADGEWEFYSQNGICLPLPITQHHFPGQHYAFGVFIVLNLLLFLFVGAGQLLIYHTIRSTPMAGGSQRRQQDMAIARRLFLIVFSDFCCWFPVGLMGLLASRGTPIPGVVNVWSAILVMPLNSAINPFLYTLSTLLERKKKLREQKRTQAVLNRLHVDIVNWPKDKLEELALHVSRATEKLRCQEHPTEELEELAVSTDHVMESFRCQERPTNILQVMSEDFGTYANDLREVGTNQEERTESILGMIRMEFATWPKDKLQKLIRVAQQAEASSTHKGDPTTSSLQIAMLSGVGTSTSDGGDIPMATIHPHYQEEGKESDPDEAITISSV